MTETNQVLLGRAIRAFREQSQPNKISQFRLATLMNWEGTAPVIEIEKGRRLPRPETLNAIGEALQLSHADIAYLQGLAGYRALTVMPPIEQVKRSLRGVEAEITQLRFPVFILDYQFRIWLRHSAVATFPSVMLDHLDLRTTQPTDAFSLIFDSRTLDTALVEAFEVIEREAIYRFKIFNLYRRHEPFYLAYPDCMQTKLIAEDYARFVRFWNEIDAQKHHLFPLTPQLLLKAADYVLKLAIHMVEIAQLDGLFIAAYLVPTDDGTGNRERCEALFSQ